MKQVLLTLEKPSDWFIESFKESGLDNPPYAILLLEKRVTEKYTIEPRPEDIVRKEENKTISAYDRVPKTHYSYEQSCIVYDTKEDLEANNGTYWDFLPEEVEGDLYEYTAKII